MTEVPRNHTTMHPHSAGLPPKQAEADLIDNLARRVYELESSLIKARRDISNLLDSNADLVLDMDEIKRKEGEEMAEKRYAKPGDHIAITTTVEGDAYEPGDVFEVGRVEIDGVFTKHPEFFITHEEYEVLNGDPAAAMLTPDERDHYEADGRKLPAHHYIEGAHGLNGVVGKRKEPSYSAEELYSASAAERYGHLKAVEAGDGRLYNVKLYTANANYHVLRLDDETLARLESDLETDVAENFTQYYCHDAEAVVGVRLDAVELYTVKVAEE